MHSMSSSPGPPIISKRLKYTPTFAVSKHLQKDGNSVGASHDQSSIINCALEAFLVRSQYYMLNQETNKHQAGFPSVLKQRRLRSSELSSSSLLEYLDKFTGALFLAVALAYITGSVVIPAGNATAVGPTPLGSSGLTCKTWSIVPDSSVITAICQQLNEDIVDTSIDLSQCANNINGILGCAVK